MTTPDPILDPLNPAQREAVTTTEGPVLVIAGAGTGKTRVITHRIAHLVRNCDVPPWRIFAATFTNKAAGEMKHRVEGLLPGLESTRVSVATFHSICVGILRRESGRVGLSPQFTIADESDQIALVKDCLKRLDVEPNTVAPREVLGWISSAKTMMYTPEQARSGLTSEWGELYPAVYELYDRRLAENNAVDFDDLLLKVVRLYRDQDAVLAEYQDRWRYFLIDEYQDINQVQYELVNLLASREGNLFVVGDEDQTIYSWRGADVDNILKFAELFEGTRTIRLEQNYRSTETILMAANAVIARNRDRLGKSLWTGREAGEPLATIVGANEREEAARVIETIRWLRRLTGASYRDVAIFYRVNALSRLFEDFLRQAAIPYRVIGGIRFYDRAEIKDLIAYLRLSVNPMDGLSLSRVINRPRRGIGEKTLGKLASGAASKGISVCEYLPEAARDKSLPSKARAGLADLADRMQQWRELAADCEPIDVLDRVLRDTGYEESLGDPRSLEAISRRENIAELRRAIEDFVKTNPGGTLGEYLEMAALAASIDEMTDDDDCVSLMTLHSAKGLEFPCVFLTGLEEGIFPNPRSVDESRGFEEERRLFYVGVTRAMDRLFLTRADSRSLYGRTQYNPPSTFLMEVPEALIQTLEQAEQALDAEHRTASRSVMMSGGVRAAALADGGEPVTDGLFPEGARVRHARLGEGKVLAVRGIGVQRKISIRFDAGLELEVLEQYGGLELVSEPGD